VFIDVCVRYIVRIYYRVQLCVSEVNVEGNITVYTDVCVIYRVMNMFVYCDVGVRYRLKAMLFSTVMRV